MHGLRLKFASCIALLTRGNEQLAAGGVVVNSRAVSPRRLVDLLCYIDDKVARKQGSERTISSIQTNQTPRDDDVVMSQLSNGALEEDQGVSSTQNAVTYEPVK